ncbi:ATP-binding cassette domain-containing protein [Pseudoscardovia suis]|uniref:ATP-binding cassette domain-containing protein n=1 Tax=Pseudoscardovia suis TaxID=987063 RepID=UPI003F9617A4
MGVVLLIAVAGALLAALLTQLMVGALPTAMPSVVLEIKHVSKSYQDGTQRRTVLHDVNLAVHAGEFVAIVGPSGSGKSTFHNITGMMLSPDEGQAVLGGKDVSHARKREWTALRRELLVMVITIAVPHASTEGVTAYGITVENTARPRRCRPCLPTSCRPWWRIFRTTR